MPSPFVRYQGAVTPVVKRSLSHTNTHRDRDSETHAYERAEEKGVCRPEGRNKQKKKKIRIYRGRFAQPASGKGKEQGAVDKAVYGQTRMYRTWPSNLLHAYSFFIEFYVGRFVAREFSQ